MTAEAQHLHLTRHMLTGFDDFSTVTGDWNNWRFTWLGACSKRKRITDANCWQLEPKWLRKDGVGEGLLLLPTAIACCCLGTGWEATNRIACFARAVAFAKGPLLLLHACQVPIHGTRQAHNAILPILAALAAAVLGSAPPAVKELKELFAHNAVHIRTCLWDEREGGEGGEGGDGKAVMAAPVSRPTSPGSDNHSSS